MTTSVDLKQQVQQIHDTTLKKINRTFLSSMFMVLTGSAVVITPVVFARQAQNPYTQAPEVQTYAWTQRSLMQVQGISYPHSSLLTDPPVPDASLSALVEHHNTQFSAPHLSLQQTADSLNKRLEELATLQPVIDYRAFEANRGNLPNHPLMMTGIALILLGYANLVIRGLRALDERYKASRLEQQARKLSTQPDT